MTPTQPPPSLECWMRPLIAMSLVGALALCALSTPPLVAQEEPLKPDESEVTVFVDGRGLGSERLEVILKPLWSGDSREAPGEAVTLRDDGADTQDTPGDGLFVGRGRVDRAEFLAITLKDPNGGGSLGARRTPLPSSQRLRIFIIPPSLPGGALTLRLLEEGGPAPTLDAKSGSPTKSGGTGDPALSEGPTNEGFGPWALAWGLLLGGLGVAAAFRAAKAPGDGPHQEEPQTGLIVTTLGGDILKAMPPLLGLIPFERDLTLHCAPPSQERLALAIAIELGDLGINTDWIGSPPKSEALKEALAVRGRRGAGLPRGEIFLRSEGKMGGGVSAGGGEAPRMLLRLGSENSGAEVGLGEGQYAGRITILSLPSKGDDSMTLLHEAGDGSWVLSGPST